MGTIIIISMGMMFSFRPVYLFYFKVFGLTYFVLQHTKNLKLTD